MSLCASVRPKCSAQVALRAQVLCASCNAQALSTSVLSARVSQVSMSKFPEQADCSMATSRFESNCRSRPAKILSHLQVVIFQPELERSLSVTFVLLTF